MTKRWLKGILTLAASGLVAGCGGARLPTKPGPEDLLIIEGQVKDGPYHLGRADLEGLVRAGFQARPPGAEAPSRFDGISLQRLLAFYIQPQAGADTLVFVTKDGLAVPVGVGLIRQYGPILADRLDGAAVAPRLAWPNLDQRGLDADPRAGLWWAGPVVRIEVVDWDKTWGRVIRAPAGSPDEARLGASQYLVRCAGCHRHHGVGGQRGPGLDGAVARLGAAGFAAAVLRHPGWPSRVGAELWSAEAVAGQVAAFLAASDQAGVPPPEQAIKPAPRPARRPGP